MAAAEPRVMADSNVIIAGVLKPRWFHAFLRHALSGRFRNGSGRDPEGYRGLSRRHTG